VSPVRFAVVGSGWRAEYFFRIAATRPDRFEISGVLVRRHAEVDRVAAEHGLAAVTDPERIDELEPDFVVVATSAATNADVCEQLTRRGHAVLLETPAGVDDAQFDRLDALAATGARVQVAEQYQFQPLLAARLAVIRSGRLGPITSARVSVAHEYHGVALLRAALGVGIDAFSVKGHVHHSSITRGPDRTGSPDVDELVPSTEVVAAIDFDGRLGVYDWTDDQYFSWIRALRFVVRGERGEIDGDTVRYLDDAGDPVEQTLHRWDTGLVGNLEAPGHRGYLLGDEWVYRNPFPTTRWSDDEIAVATVLDEMATYVAHGIEFYPLAEGVHDARVAAAIRTAIASSG
jgi:predicted dehydrogenase